jgi:DNA-binding LacI/PurR family transcriptional regulator
LYILSCWNRFQQGSLQNQDKVIVQGRKAMPATIRDVAREANVGIGTVSRVLNNNPNVSEDTRQRVLAVIDRLDFSPSPTARRLSLGRTHTIGILAPFFITPSCIERLRGISVSLYNTEYDYMLFNVETVERRNDYLQSIPRSRRIDGLLIITLTLTPQEEALLHRENLTTVMVDQRAQTHSHVAIDDELGGWMATSHLIAQGHRAIGLVGDYFSDIERNPFQYTANRDRYHGYRRALTEAGIPFRPEWHRQGLHTQRSARSLTHELLALPEPPTAIFAASDTQALGVLEAARERGLSVPDDLAVVGFDDLDIARYLNLSTVRQPLFESGVEATEILLGLLEKRLTEPVSKLLPLELVVRQSSGVPIRQPAVM